MAQSDISAETDPPHGGAVKSGLTGSIFAVDAVGHCLALATICFGGALAAGIGPALAVFVAGSLLSTLILNRFSEYGLSMGIAQDTAIAILVPALAVASATLAGSPEAQIATTFAIIAAGTFLSASAFLLVGIFGLGRMMRMFPYSVAAGFLASSGYILASISFELVEEAAASPTNAWEMLLVFGPLLATVALMLLADAFIGGALALLLAVFGATAVFYGLVAVFDVDPALIASSGWLQQIDAFEPFEINAALFGQIDWGSVIGSAPTLAAVMAINLLAVLLNGAGVELAKKTTVDVNRELRLAGLVNLACACFGCLTSFLQNGSTVLASRYNLSPTPFLIGYCLTLAAAVFVAAQIVALVPVFVAAAFVTFVGISMLRDWLLNTYHRLLLADWLIVVGIVLVTIVVGILPAIGVGFVLALANFAKSYVQLPLVNGETDLARRPSVLDRAPDAQAWLLENGARTRILHLNGALFFGSVQQLVNRIRALLEEAPDLEGVILDLSGIQSFDSSACAAFERLDLLARQEGLRIVLTEAAPELSVMFDRWGMSIAGTDRPGTGLRLGADLEDALEEAEDATLPAALTAEGTSLETALGSLARGDKRLPDLLARLDRVTLAPGEILIRRGDASRDVFFLETGRLGVFLPASDPGGTRRRVRSFGPGAVFGEVAFLLSMDRSADIEAEAASTVLRLTAEDLEALRSTDPAMAELVATLLARALSLKVLQTNALVTRRQ